MNKPPSPSRSHFDTWTAWRFAAATVLATLVGVLPACAGEALLLKGATVHTVSGATLAPGDVLIRDAKIINAGANLAADGARVVDLSGKHLYPGLVLATTSLGLTEIEAVRATQDKTEVGDYTPDVQAWIAVNPDSELLPVARANGVTHALVTPAGGIVSGFSGLVQLDGWTVEEMTVKAPAALHVYWPRLDLDTTPKELARDKARWKSVDDQDKERRKILRHIDDFFEEAASYGRAKKAGTLKESVPAWESMLPVVEGTTPIIVHADDVRQIRSAVAWVKQRGYKAILAGGRDAAMAAELLATNRIPVIYEQVFERPNREHEPYDLHFKTPSVLHKAGVKVAISLGLSSDAAMSARNLPYLAAHALAYGLSRDEAIKCITLNPAEMLGVSDRLGSIAAGKEATLFVADGDILDVRSNVSRLWIAGKEVPLDSRHTRLYSKYRNRPKPIAQPPAR